MRVVIYTSILLALLQGLFIGVVVAILNDPGGAAMGLYACVLLPFSFAIPILAFVSTYHLGTRTLERKLGRRLHYAFRVLAAISALVLFLGIMFGLDLLITNRGFSASVLFDKDYLPGVIQGLVTCLFLPWIYDRVEQFTLRRQAR